MPLDTAPLSPKRKLAAFGALLAFLAGSLGLAQFIVANHKGGNHWSEPFDPSTLVYPVKYIVIAPENFSADRRDDQGNVDIWTRNGPAGKRMIERIDFPYFLSDAPRAVKERDLRNGIEEHLDTQFDLKPKFLKPVAFGGHDAKLFIGTDSKGKTRAYVITLGIRDHYIALIYSGDKESAVTPTPPLTAADEAAVLEMCSKSTVVLIGGTHTPQKLPQTAPTTLPQQELEKRPDLEITPRS